MLSADWLIERFPDDAIAMMRFFGSLKTCNLRKVEMLSTPALVRVSANITSPSRTRIPPQYVIDSLAPPSGVYSIFRRAAEQDKQAAYCPTLTATARLSPP